MKITGRGKLVVGLMVVGALVAGKCFWYDTLPKTAKAAAEIGRVALPDAPEASLSGNAAQLALPSDQVSGNGGTKIDCKIMAWNSQFALMYANGGPQTTKGSLFDKATLQVNLIRQDDCNKTCADLVKFSQDYKKDPSTTAVFGMFMGDGMPAFFAGLCKELSVLGADYQPVGIYACGKSYGEDQLMAPPAWKTDPKSAIGKCVACVIRDGDMNIALQWCGSNGIKVNPDETSYDANALNLISANDFLDAPNKYITGYQEKRKLIVDGKKTSKDTVVGVDAVATWTPGDVNVATKKGGLITVVSTKQYASQMPCLIVTIKKWANDHRTDVENMIVAMGQAGDQVRSFGDAKMFAAKVSAKVYAEQDAIYWLKYYNGMKQKDAEGLDVNLGGSMAFNLSDAADFFGMGKDGIDRYKIVYTTFGDIIKKMYPEIMPTYPEYSKIMDKSFLMSVVANHTELMQGKAIQVQYADQITSTVSSKSYQIQFEVGSAKIKGQSSIVLDEIFKNAIVAEGCKLGIYGHTDNTGSSDANALLSDARANAVRDYLINKGMKARAIEAKGYGDTQPIASNSTAAGRATNRRVQIVLGN
jgi:outer membrane protein OmpA-like peptidoglycan-associated protein